MDPNKDNPAPATPSPTPAPASNPAPTTPDSNAVDPIKLAEELGKTKATNAEYEDYIRKVVPILQMINEDPELAPKVVEKFNQKMGNTPPPTPPADSKDKTPTPTAPDPVAMDNRNALVVNTVNGFLKDKGISGLDEKESLRIQGMLASELGEILDPQGNKTLPQIFQEVSLTKLPQFLNKAWSLVEVQLNRKQDPVVPQLNRAAVPGAIGSMAAGGGGMDQSGDDIVLTDAERKTASNMGITEEKYLENKKALAKLRASESY